MRRIEAKACYARFSERKEFVCPPVEQRVSAACVVEIHVGNVVLAMRVTWVQSRFFRFERMKPVRMVGEECAVGGNPVDHEIDEYPHFMTLGGLSEAAYGFGCGLLRLEHRVQALVVAHHLRIPRLARLKQRADQDMVEAKLGRVREPCRPRIERSDQRRVKKIDPRGIPL